MIRSSNPAFRAGSFQNASELVGASSLSRSELMTVEGTVNKSFILLAITMAVGFFAWNQFLTQAQFMGSMPTHYIWIGLLGGLVLALITAFLPKYSMITAPIYGALEGLALGGISALMELQFPGIATQALFGTTGVFLTMLILYRTKIITVTDKLRMGIFMATGGIAIIYLASMVMGFFGTTIPFIHESGPIGIGFSVLVVGIAAFNLLLDFDMIEKRAESGAPKYMEWYGAFALLVTLVWLYIEVLRLIAKARSNR